MTDTMPDEPSTFVRFNGGEPLPVTVSGFDMAIGKDESVITLSDGTTMTADQFNDLSKAMTRFADTATVQLRATLAGLTALFSAAGMQRCSLCDGWLGVGPTHRNYADCLAVRPKAVAELVRRRSGRRIMAARLARYGRP